MRANCSTHPFESSFDLSLVRWVMIVRGSRFSFRFDIVAVCRTTQPDKSECDRNAKSVLIPTVDSNLRFQLLIQKCTCTTRISLYIPCDSLPEIVPIPNVNKKFYLPSNDFKRFAFIWTIWKQKIGQLDESGKWFLFWFKFERPAVNESCSFELFSFKNGKSRSLSLSL